MNEIAKVVFLDLNKILDHPTEDQKLDAVQLELDVECVDVI